MSNPILDGSAFLSSGIDTDEEFQDEIDSEPEEEVEEEEEEIAETAEEDTAVVPEYNDKTTSCFL